MSKYRIDVAVDNLPQIAAGYSDGVAARVLVEVCNRIQAQFDGVLVECEIAPWGVSVELAKVWRGMSRVRQLEEKLKEICSVPITIGHLELLVALSLLAPGRNEYAVSAVVDVDQFHRDMSVAISAYRHVFSWRLAFAEEDVNDVNLLSDGLYRECLVRITDCSGAAVMPGHYFPSLERMGLVRVIDRQIVRAVMDSLTRRPDVTLGCNISAASCVNDIWWHSILTDLRLNPDVAKRLVIEITETVPLRSIKSGLELVNALKRTGCKIALDDFGAGYSGISFAKAALPDIIKIDRSFLRFGTGDVERLRMLTNLVTLAGNFATEIVVEGVETEADLVNARIAGARWCQGFLFNQVHRFNDGALRAPAVSLP